MNGSPAVCLAFAALLVVGCRTPTQVTVELSTDVPCSASPVTTLQVGGSVVELEKHGPVIRTTNCNSTTGRIGSVVVVPSGASDATFVLKAVLAHGVTSEECQSSPSLKGCIIARRELGFRPHSELSLPIELRRECEGVPCRPTETCVRGKCVPADMTGAPPCGDGGCGEIADASEGGLVDASGDSPFDARETDSSFDAQDRESPSDADAQDRAPTSDADADGPSVPPGVCVVDAGAGVGEGFSTDMIGCPGHVPFAQRASLCGNGYRPCTVDQWIARRLGRAPHHHYWTNDNLDYVSTSSDGKPGGCYYSKTYGGACASATHVCADVDVDTEGNSCGAPPSIYARNCGRLDPTPPANEYFGGFGTSMWATVAGTLCCCIIPSPSPCELGGGAPSDDVYSDVMVGCPNAVPWWERNAACRAPCMPCTADQWIGERHGKSPKRNYWTSDVLKMSGSGDGMCYVSKAYGMDGPPSYDGKGIAPMRVCASHQDGDKQECEWINCGAADIPPPPNEYLGGCSDVSAGTLCCKP